MQRRSTLRHALLGVALLASALGMAPRSARAQASPAINMHYWSGPLIQHAKVTTLFWGPYWGGNFASVSYFNNFFQALFADGRYMANLAQYNVGGYAISNGTWNGSDNDSQALPNSNQVTD